MKKLMMRMGVESSKDSHSVLTKLEFIQQNDHMKLQIHELDHISD
ncbi:hypothetical protein NC651_016272 [Populus alba x Populus x berolinensis]|uniref:Uncharacterized protein n=1 Tax=Populus alba x Populus x berolinensis TaxID=444605 RepID=A0AAD6VZQ8_9ROSI|nr:hypothetical protein NC651_016272 [Populus alba x Populus x berolinensis]KAJ6993677.1 hypothetical protein NC653_016727 [Populus alba x Populus x berolinensis]